MNNFVQVVVRVRPPLPRELHGDLPFQNVVAVDKREQQIIVSENLGAVLDESGELVANPGPYSTFSFFFDYVYDETASQKKVYENTARAVVESALQGYNATIFAYGKKPFIFLCVFTLPCQQTNKTTEFLLFIIYVGQTGTGYIIVIAFS